jgi:hypothetical protein
LLHGGGGVAAGQWGFVTVMWGDGHAP